MSNQLLVGSRGLAAAVLGAIVLAGRVPAQCPLCGTAAAQTLIPGTGCHAPSGFLACAPLLDGGFATPGVPLYLHVTSPSSSPGLVIVGLALALGPSVGLGPQGIRVPCLPPPRPACTMDIQPLLAMNGIASGGEATFYLSLPADPIACGLDIYGQAFVTGNPDTVSNATRWHVGDTDWLLYTIGFDTPPHTVGLPPTTTTGPVPRLGPTMISFGTPTVVATAGPFVDQPCLFDSSDGQGDQMRLQIDDLPPGYRYTLDCRVTRLGTWTGTYGNTFTIFFDAPWVRRLDFHADGSVEFLGATIAQLPFAAPMDVRVDINLATDHVTVRLDGNLAYSGGFGGATMLTSIRISTPVTTSPPAVTAAVDDIVVRTWR